MSETHPLIKTKARKDVIAECVSRCEMAASNLEGAFPHLNAFQSDPPATWGWRECLIGYLSAVARDEEICAIALTGYNMGVWTAPLCGQGWKVLSALLSTDHISREAVSALIKFIAAAMRDENRNRLLNEATAKALARKIKHTVDRKRERATRGIYPCAIVIERIPGDPQQDTIINQATWFIAAWGDREWIVPRSFDDFLFFDDFEKPLDFSKFLPGFLKISDDALVEYRPGKLGSDDCALLRIVSGKSAPTPSGDDLSFVSDESKKNPLFGIW